MNLLAEREESSMDLRDRGPSQWWWRSRNFEHRRVKLGGWSCNWKKGRWSGCYHQQAMWLLVATSQGVLARSSAWLRWCNAWMLLWGWGSMYCRARCNVLTVTASQQDQTILSKQTSCFSGMKMVRLAWKRGLQGAIRKNMWTKILYGQIIKTGNAKRYCLQVGV